MNDLSKPHVGTAKRDWSGRCCFHDRGLGVKESHAERPSLGPPAAYCGDGPGQFARLVPEGVEDASGVVLLRRLSELDRR